MNDRSYPDRIPFRTPAILCALLILIACFASVSTAFQQGDVFQVQSITPFSNGTYDVKLFNQRTHYVHSVTVTADIIVGIAIGDLVYETIGPNVQITLQKVGQSQPEPGFCAPSQSLKLLGNCVCTSPVTGDPINVATGNVFYAVTDYQTVGLNKLSFSRYYNSRGASNTFAYSLGANWRSTYDRYLKIAPSSSVSVERADGQIVAFTWNGIKWLSDSDIDEDVAAAVEGWCSG